MRLVRQLVVVAAVGGRLGRGWPARAPGRRPASGSSSVSRCSGRSSRTSPSSGTTRSGATWQRARTAGTHM